MMFFKRILLYMDMVINYGISPATIVKNRRHLQLPGFDKGVKDKNEHGM